MLYPIFYINFIFIDGKRKCLHLSLQLRLKKVIYNSLLCSNEPKSLLVTKNKRVSMQQTVTAQDRVFLVSYVCKCLKCDRSEMHLGVYGEKQISNH